VVTAGAASLTTEMAGARLLAPFFGASNLVWANVIGLTLIYLALGAWLGGRLADRYPTERALACVVLAAAISLAILPFVTRPLFGLAADAFDELSTGAFIGSFLATMLTFCVPLTALGAVTPWAVRLAMTDVSGAGRVAGRLSALSTLGAIGGTFLPVLVLIPAIGTRRTLLLAAAALALAATPATPRWGRLAAPMLVILTVMPTGGVKSARAGERLLFEAESPYQYVQVVEQADGDRVLHLNEGWAVHSILPAGGGVTGGYWDAFLALPVLARREKGRLAVLGNAGGTVANLYELTWPGYQIDGVEIDPTVSSVGRRFLGMRNPALTVHTADARHWTASSTERFDAVIVDAYRQPYIPFHLVTREFFQEVRARLEPHGVLAINVGTPPDELAVVDRIAATMRAEFPAVQVARYDEFNSIVLGFSDVTAAGLATKRLLAAQGSARAPSQILAERLRPTNPTDEPFTDDRAPVELLTDQGLLAYLRSGAPGA
jgi:spermidine synthase